MMTKAERIGRIFLTIEEAARCSSRDEAMRLIAKSVNGTEDECTDIPFNPALWREDGRIYPPQEDMRIEIDGCPEVCRYNNIKHITWVARNGAIMITERRTGRCVLEKPGTDGQTISALLHSCRSKDSQPS
jgi:hypothetical protein